MKRMVSDDLRLKSVKVGDNDPQVTIPKEMFNKDSYGYYINIKTLGQSSSDGTGNIILNVNGEYFGSSVSMFRNAVYTIGILKYDEQDSDVVVVISGIVQDLSDYSITAEMVLTVPNTTLEEAISSTIISGAEDYDLYIIK